MFSPEHLQLFATWLGYTTIFLAILTVLGLILKWGFRFRLVGVTSFMGVLTAGLFALSVSLYIRPSIPGTVHFARVFDTGGSQVVIAVSDQITAAELDATLHQAAIDLYSPGRLSQRAGKMTIRARTVLHPRPGVSEPLYLGKIQRSLAVREDDQMVVDIYQDKLAQLPHPTA